MTNRGRRWLPLLALAAGAAAAQVSPNGGEFQVNTYTTGNQQFAGAAAADAQGRFIVTWAGPSEADQSGIHAQRFDSEVRRWGPNSLSIPTQPARSWIQV